MCSECENPYHIDFKAELEIFQERLSEMDRLTSVADKLSNRDKSFANDLIATFISTHSLSDPISKALGYGPTCADNYNLPYSTAAAKAA